MKCNKPKYITDILNEKEIIEAYKSMLKRKTPDSCFNWITYDVWPDSCKRPPMLPFSHLCRKRTGWRDLGYTHWYEEMQDRFNMLSYGWL